jgi:hypothetical protein
MGMDRNVIFPGAPPAWPAVATLLAEKGVSIQMRMIDGELAFPDEQPPETWREIRVGCSGAMVTVRRLPEQVTLVVWGNADGNTRALWNALTWAWAAAGAGTIQTTEGPRDAAAFAAEVEFPQ